MLPGIVGRWHPPSLLARPLLAGGRRAPPHRRPASDAGRGWLGRSRTALGRHGARPRLAPRWRSAGVGKQGEASHGGLCGRHDGRVVFRLSSLVRIRSPVVVRPSSPAPGPGTGRDHGEWRWGEGAVVVRLPRHGDGRAKDEAITVNEKNNNVRRPFPSQERGGRNRQGGTGPTRHGHQFTFHSSPHAGGGRQSAAKSLNRALAWQGRAAGRQAGGIPSWSACSVVPVLVMVRSRSVGRRRRVCVDGRGHGRGCWGSRPCRRGGCERAWLSVQAARLCVEVPRRDAAVRCCFLSAGLREEGRGRGGRRREWCSRQNTATN